MKDVIVCFATQGREDYRKGLLKLIDSCAEHWKGDMLVYSPDHWLDEYKGVKINKHLPEPKGVKYLPHNIMPYQFKVAIIQQAIEMGYERVIWLDSSMVLTKDITKLFVGDTGVITFHNLGHPLYKYISDLAVQLLNVSAYSLLEIEQIWGGALLFDFTKKNAVEVFEEIKEFSLNGSFSEMGSNRPGFIAHRHDQAVMSVLVHKKCHMHQYGKIVCPPHDKTFEYGKEFYLICR